PSIWNTLACFSGSFDTGTCLAEAWIRSPGGGGFCIMNTRYGWGEPAEPGGQWSDLVDQEFFAKFFTEDMYQLGVAFMMAKDEFIPLIPSDTHYDWIAKSNTLFGDPELPMYTQVPGIIETGDISLIEGQTDLTVAVTSGGSPLENARVCLLQGEWDEPVTYAVGLTNGSGTATLTWPQPLETTPDTVRVTVWARDHELNTQLVTVGNTGTGSESSGSVATMTVASQNPLRGTASISWTLPGVQKASISIIDLAGRTVSTHELQGLSGEFSWNALDSPAGVYFLRMTVENGDQIQKRLVVIR
ncbi:MAG: C25 family cysteine peptidase, partial [Candidatus Neomarinimicrobiota bacterium]